MPKMTVVNVRLSDKQLRDLTKLSVSLGLDRSNLIRLAIARLVEAESHRKS